MIPSGEFDMRVKSCEASDNRNRPIQLSDAEGCVLRYFSAILVTAKVDFVVTCLVPSKAQDGVQVHEDALH